LETTVNNEIKNTETFLRSGPNRQKVDNYLRKWNVYSAKLKDWKNTAIKKISDNAKELEQLKPQVDKWNAVKKDSLYRRAPREFRLNVNKTAEELNRVFNHIKNDMLLHLEAEAKVTELSNRTENTMERLQEFKNTNTYHYLYKRHEVIWKKEARVSGSSESQTSQLVLKKEFDHLLDYAKASPSDIINYILILIILYFTIRYLRRSFIKYPLTNKENYLSHFEELFVTYSRVVFIFSALLVLRIYVNDFERIIIDSIGILLLISALPIIRPYEDKRFGTLLIMVAILVSIDSLKTYTWFSSFEYRLFLLGESLIAMMILGFFLGPSLFKDRKITGGKFTHTAVKLSPFIFGILLLSIISNILGYTNLTDLSLKLCIMMGGVSIIFYATVLLTESMAISIINRHYGVNPGYAIEERKIIEKQTLNFIKGFSYVVWTLILLKIIDKLDPLYEYLQISFTEVYKVGKVEFTIGAIISFFVILFVSYTISKIVAFLINDGNGALKVFKMSKGVPNAISVILRYFIIAIGFILAISILGIDLSTFNLLAGALGLGIGFGLQTIISNFVSGLILIFERPILPGDSVEVNNLWGTVSKVGVRASVINTYDGAEVIVPNNSLITNDLINWTHSSKLRRMEIKVGTAYGSNPNEVIQILKEAAQEHSAVLKDPEPLILFEGFGESALDFSLKYWVYFENGLSSKSEIAIDIYNRFEKAGIEIPFPQRDVHIKSLSKGEDQRESTIGFKGD